MCIWELTIVALVLLALLAALEPSLVAVGVVASIPAPNVPFVRGELTLTHLVLFGLIAGWGVIFWQQRIWLDSIVVGFLLVLAAYSVSFIEADTPHLWFQEAYRWAVAGVIYVICRSVITNAVAIRRVIWVMTIGVMSVSVLAFWQLLLVSVPNMRVTATLGTPNPLAACLEMIVPVLLAGIAIVWIKREDPLASGVEKWILVTVSGLGLSAIGLTQSRGGSSGIAAAYLVLADFLATSSGQSQLKRFSPLGVELTNERVVDTTSWVLVGGVSVGLGASNNRTQAISRVGAKEFEVHHR